MRLLIITQLGLYGYETTNLHDFVYLSVRSVEQNYFIFSYVCQIYVCQSNMADNFLFNKPINTLNILKQWGGSIFLKRSEEFFVHFLGYIA